MNDPNYGRAWRLVPLREEQRLWTWACSKSGQKLIPFLFAAALDKCRAVAADRIARGKHVEPWVAETVARLASEQVDRFKTSKNEAFQDAKNFTRPDSRRLP